MQSKKFRRIFLVAGGSGGHITPVIELGKKWKNNEQNKKLILITNKKKNLKTDVSHDINLENTKFIKLINVPKKKNFFLLPLFLIQMTTSILKSIFYILKYNPEKVISTGSYISIPVCIAAKILRKKIELHELNLIPGKAIKFLSPIARDVFTTFEKSKSYFKKAVHLEKYPLRFSEKDKRININKKNISKLFEDFRKTVFIIGGSQGSVFLNNLIKSWAEKNSYKNIQIIHQTGMTDKTDWSSFYFKNKIPAHFFEYQKDIEKIKEYYLASDIIISRGGAGTLFELEFFQKKSILIPIRNKANNHQHHNALAMKEKNPNLFRILDEKQLIKNKEIFFSTLNDALR